MAVQILPGIDEYLAKGIKNLGNTASLFFETDRSTQRAIRNMLLEKPEMIQEFADLETNAPGSLKRLGFGSVADMVTKTPESFKQEKEKGERDLYRATKAPAMRTGIAEAEIGATGTEKALEILTKQAGLSEDFARSILKLPSTLDERAKELKLPVLEREAENAKILMSAAERGDDITGPMLNYVEKFRTGEDDPTTTSTIIAHPLLGPQFDALFKQESERDLARIRAEAQQLKVPASAQSEINELLDVIAAADDAVRLLTLRPDGVGGNLKTKAGRAILKNFGEVGATVINSLDPEGTALRSSIEKVKVMTTHPLFGAAFTKTEKQQIMMLVPSILDDADIVRIKLDMIKGATELAVQRRMAEYGREYIGGSISVSGPRDFMQDFIDNLLKKNYSDEKIIEEIGKIGGSIPK